MFVLGLWGECRQYSGSFSLHRKAVQMFLRAGLRFPVFLLLGCSCSSCVAKVLPHTALAFLFFLRVGLQQEGHLQASSK